MNLNFDKVPFFRHRDARKKWNDSFLGGRRLLWNHSSVLEECSREVGSCIRLLHKNIDIGLCCQKCLVSQIVECSWIFY